MGVRAKRHGFPTLLLLLLSCQLSPGVPWRSLGWAMGVSGKSFPSRTNHQSPCASSTPQVGLDGPGADLQQREVVVV